MHAKNILLIIISLLYSCEGLKNKSSHDDHQIVTLRQENKKQELAKIEHPLSDGLFKGSIQSKEVIKYCDKVDQKNYQYGWPQGECIRYDWIWVRKSFWGNLIWVHFGEPESVAADTTIIFCGVHGDEITPMKFCYDVMNFISSLGQELKGNRVIVAPLVTPDSYLKKYPTRTNARGVDVNRNFPTRDWDKDALRLWKSRYRRSKRRFPGKVSKSEQETYFQINLINRYKPSKIISVHAPLTIIDYDGPRAKKGSKSMKARTCFCN